jgi:hypothetical protein
MESTHHFPAWLLAIIIIAAIFELIMKGIALWKAAKSNQSNWFVALFLINTAGILPLIYLKFFKKNNTI